MPTSGDLKSGDFSFARPPHPEEKGDETTPHQIDLHAPKST